MTSICVKDVQQKYGLFMQNVAVEFNHFIRSVLKTQKSLEECR